MQEFGILNTLFQGRYIFCQLIPVSLIYGLALEYKSIWKTATTWWLRNYDKYSAILFVN